MIRTNQRKNGMLTAALFSGAVLLSLSAAAQTSAPVPPKDSGSTKAPAAAGKAPAGKDSRPPDVQYGRKPDGRKPGVPLPDGIIPPNGPLPDGIISRSIIHYGLPQNWRARQRYDHARSGVNYDALTWDSWLTGPIVLGGQPISSVYGTLPGVPAGSYIYNGWGDAYFPGAWAYYPYYSPGYINGITVLSPYSVYYGSFPAYIGISSVSFTAPTLYLPTPVYTAEGVCTGWSGYRRPNNINDYYLSQGQPQSREDNSENAPPVRTGTRAVDQTIDDIITAWNSGNIGSLAKHVGPHKRIAIELGGRYVYSLEPGDYLDMTRDAFRSTRTMSYVLDSAKRRRTGVYVVVGKHHYQSLQGEDHVVYLSYVLEKSNNAYIITQIGVSPERVEP